MIQAFAKLEQAILAADAILYGCPGTLCSLRDEDVASEGLSQVVMAMTAAPTFEVKIPDEPDPLEPHHVEEAIGGLVRLPVPDFAAHFESRTDDVVLDVVMLVTQEEAGAVRMMFAVYHNEVERWTVPPLVIRVDAANPGNIVHQELGGFTVDIRDADAFTESIAVPVWWLSQVMHTVGAQLPAPSDAASDPDRARSAS
jgi:hypothetical protein